MNLGTPYKPIALCDLIRCGLLGNIRVVILGKRQLRRWRRNQKRAYKTPIVNPAFYADVFDKSLAPGLRGERFPLAPPREA